jgi:hypothetical protein
MRKEKHKSRVEIRKEPRGVPTGWPFIKVSKYQMDAIYNQLSESFSNYFYMHSHLTPFFIALLSLPRIPPQLATDTVHPVFAPPSLRHHICEGVSTGTNCDIISRPQLDPFSAIETCPATSSRVIRNTYPEDNGIRQDDGPEGESVRADSCHKDHRVLWMAKRSAGCEIVGCRTGGSGNADTIGLN